MFSRRRGGKRSQLISAGQREIGDAIIPYEIRLEQRRDTRYSLTQKKAYLRLPLQLPTTEIDRASADFHAWLTKTVQARPKLEEAHVPRAFSSGQVWQLGSYAYRLQIDRVATKSSSGKLLQELDPSGVKVARLRLSLSLSAKQEPEVIEKLLYKIAGNEAFAEIEQRLQQINRSHFNVAVSRLKLSPTSSRWGSCSAQGTISISSRLLAAPARCIHAVLVHELAHRIEMNHSQRFWDLVYAAMPDYDTAHNWLKKNGQTLGWKLQATETPQ